MTAITRTATAATLRPLRLATASIAVLIGIATPAALATASPAAAAQWQGDVKDYPYTYHVPDLWFINNQYPKCPDDHPFLINENDAPGRIMPNGVSVDAPNGVGASGDTQTGHVPGTGDSRMAVGVKALSMTNYLLDYQTVVVTLHCSNAWKDGYAS